MATQKANTKPIIKFKKLHPDAKIPERKTLGAVGFDLVAVADVTIRNTNAEPKAVCIPTGLALEIPQGYHGKVFLRSSTGLNTKLRLANGTGIIDSDYRGEVLILAENNSRTYVHVKKGERVAQLLIEKTEDVVFEETDELAESERGTKGHGSTGRM